MPEKGHRKHKTYWASDTQQLTFPSAYGIISRYPDFVSTRPRSWDSGASDSAAVAALTVRL